MRMPLDVCSFHAEQSLSEPDVEIADRAPYGGTMGRDAGVA